MMQPDSSIETSSVNNNLGAAAPSSGQSALRSPLKSSEWGVMTRSDYVEMHTRTDLHPNISSPLSALCPVCV